MKIKVQATRPALLETIKTEAKRRAIAARILQPVSGRPFLKLEGEDQELEDLIVACPAIIEERADILIKTFRIECADITAADWPRWFYAGANL